VRQVLQVLQVLQVKRDEVVAAGNELFDIDMLS
jgi:hypothetical protein